MRGFAPSRRLKNWQMRAIGSRDVWAGRSSVSERSNGDTLDLCRSLRECRRRNTRRELCDHRHRDRMLSSAQPEYCELIAVEIVEARSPVLLRVAIGLGFL